MFNQNRIFLHFLMVYGIIGPGVFSLYVVSPLSAYPKWYIETLSVFGDGVSFAFVLTSPVFIATALILGAVYRAKYHYSIWVLIAMVVPFSIISEFVRYALVSANREKDLDLSYKIMAHDLLYYEPLYTVPFYILAALVCRTVLINFGYR